MSIESIRQRVTAATPGPWEWTNPQPVTDEGDIVLRAPDAIVEVPGFGHYAKTVISAWGHSWWNVSVEPADATFIAHARTDVELLLAVAEVAALVVAQEDRVSQLTAEYLASDVFESPALVVAQNTLERLRVALRAALAALEAQP